MYVCLYVTTNLFRPVCMYVCMYAYIVIYFNYERRLCEILRPLLYSVEYDEVYECYVNNFR